MAQLAEAAAMCWQATPVISTASADLIDAVRSGDFAPSIEDALEKYREDTSPATRNYAPKEYWPSTGVFRTVFYQAGKRLGAEAVKLLEQIPDDDLRLFASIELAAALAGVPGPAITQTKQPNPPHSRSFGSGRIISSEATGREGTDGPRMRSPDGRLISLSEVPLPASDWSLLDLQMRTFLEYVLDLRPLPRMLLSVGSHSMPRLW
jgi:hypothetical protein